MIVIYNISIKEIAKKANVSISTVSRVINNKKYVREDVRNRVLAIVEEYNYTQNQFARGLKSKESKTIGLVIPDVGDEFFTEVIKGIDKGLTELGYSIFLCNTNGIPDKENMYITLLMKNQVDGIIIASVNKDSSVISDLIKSGLPLIFIDNLPKINYNVNSVTIDNFKASYIAAEYIIEMNHRNIVGIIGKQEESASFDRYMGFRKALNDYKIDFNENRIEFGDFTEASGYNAMTSLLNKYPDLTAVYCASSKMTYGAIKAIKAVNKSVPDDISVIGFDIHDKFKLISPAITSIIQPEEQIGIMAVEFLLKIINNSPNTFYHRIVLDPTIKIENSCIKI